MKSQYLHPLVGSFHFISSALRRKWLCFLLLGLLIWTTLNILHIFNKYIDGDLARKSSLDSSKNPSRNSDSHVLFRTAMFPRGGDKMKFDQPWTLPKRRVHPNMEDLMATEMGSRFLTGDFTYRFHPLLQDFLFSLIYFFMVSGLGNLMFQFAALRVLAQREGALLVLPADSMLLRSFKLDDNIRLVYGKCLRKFIEQNRHIVVEFTDCCRFYVRFNEQIFNQKDQRISIVNGYFQSFHYFHPEYEQLIRQNFEFLSGIEERASTALEKELNALEKDTWREKAEFVGVHIRHGIDLTMHARNQRYGHLVAPREYLSTAMGRFTGKRIIFLVSSDEMNWARRNIHIGNADSSSVIFFSSGFREVDMAILAKSNHSIITTGTFGWWLGYLIGKEAQKNMVYYYGGWQKPGSMLNKIVAKDEYFLPFWEPIN